MQTSRHLARPSSVTLSGIGVQRLPCAGGHRPPPSGPKLTDRLLPHKPGPRQRTLRPLAATPRIAGERFNPLPSGRRSASTGKRSRARARECRARMQRWRVRTDRARVPSAPQRSGSSRAAPAQPQGRPRARPATHDAAHPRTGSRNDPTLGAAMFSSGPNPVVIGPRQTRQGAVVMVMVVTTLGLRACARTPVNAGRTRPAGRAHQRAHLRSVAMAAPRIAAATAGRR